MSTSSPTSASLPGSDGWWRKAFARALCAALLACAACAGPLDDPSRYLYLLDDGGIDGGDGGDAGDDAGEPDGGSDAGHDGGTDGGTDAGHTDGGTHDAGTVDAGCNPIPTIISPTCATGLCHGADTQQGHLDLASPGMPARLVNQPGYGGPGNIIDPVNPDQSLMLTKLSDDPPFNFQMPLGTDPLTPAEEACIKDWIHHAVGK